MPIKSDQFTWSDEAEVFQFLHHVWDVRAAKEIIRTKKPRKVEDLDISEIADLISRRITRDDGTEAITLGVRVDWEHAKTDAIDLSVPVILAVFQDSYLPIDGWHRIAKAKLEGRVNLPCVVLNKTESARVKR